MNTLSLLAKYNQAANAEVFALLGKLTNEEREKDRGSFYGSLSGLARHLTGGVGFFQSLFKDAVKNPAALAALEPLAALDRPPEGALTEAQWKSLAAASAVLDKSLVDFTNALTDTDLNAQVKWFSGSPATVPLSFMLTALATHGTHHRGQVSQILDEMKINHDFSGISPKFIA